MKIYKFDDRINCRIPSELKADFEQTAYACGYTLSAYVIGCCYAFDQYFRSHPEAAEEIKSGKL